MSNHLGCRITWSYGQSKKQKQLVKKLVTPLTSIINSRKIMKTTLSLKQKNHPNIPHQLKLSYPTVFLPLTRKSPTTASQLINHKCWQDETKKASSKSLDVETVNLCDSNGRKRNPKLLCPNSSSEYLKCPTIESVNQLINQYEFKQTKTFIVNVGTNDIEKLPIDKVIDQTKSVLTSIRNKNPEARIMLSNLLSHSDELSKKHRT